MMLGNADPIETQFLDICQPLDHTLIGLHAGVRIIGPGRHRPFGRR